MRPHSIFFKKNKKKRSEILNELSLFVKVSVFFFFSIWVWTKVIPPYRNIPFEHCISIGASWIDCYIKLHSYVLGIGAPKDEEICFDFSSLLFCSKQIKAKQKLFLMNSVFRLLLVFLFEHLFCFFSIWMDPFLAIHHLKW